jgi:hypothetical protein
MRYSTSYANPGLKMREHLRFCYCIFFIQLNSAITVLATCLRTQGYRKEPTFHTIHRSGVEPGPPAWQAAAITAQLSTTTWRHHISLLFLVADVEDLFMRVLERSNGRHIKAAATAQKKKKKERQKKEKQKNENQKKRLLTPNTNNVAEDEPRKRAPNP